MSIFKILVEDLVLPVKQSLFLEAQSFLASTNPEFIEIETLLETEVSKSEFSNCVENLLLKELASQLKMLDIIVLTDDLNFNFGIMKGLFEAKQMEPELLSRLLEEILDPVDPQGSFENFISQTTPELFGPELFEKVLVTSTIGLDSLRPETTNVETEITELLERLSRLPKVRKLDSLYEIPIEAYLTLSPYDLAKRFKDNNEDLSVIQSSLLMCLTIITENLNDFMPIYTKHFAEFIQPAHRAHVEEYLNKFVILERTKEYGNNNELL